MAVLMGQMVARQTVFDNGTLRLSGLWDVHALTVGGSTYVYGAGYSDNGLSGFSLGADGSLTNVVNVGDTAGLTLGGANGLASAVVGGRTFLYANGYNDNGVTAFEVATDGTLTALQSVTDSAGLALARPSTRMTVSSVGPTSFLIVTGVADDGVSVFRIGTDGTLTSTATVTDAGSLAYALDGAYGTAAAQVDGRSFVVVAGGSESGLSVFELGADGSLAFRDSAFDSQNAAYRIAGSYDVTTATVNGSTYVVAAGAQEDGLSVFRMDANGQLTNVSNLSALPGVLPGVAGMSSFQLEGETFVSVSGYKGNVLGLLHLDADGVLRPAAAITDTGDLALGGSLTNAFTVVDGVPYLLGAGLKDKGISALELGGGDDILTGTSAADVLMGLGGNDTLTGNAGADRLLGGRGDDQIHAGAGDHVDGGAGTDRAHVSGLLSSYAISGTADDLTLTGITPSLGTLRLVGIESVTFGGQTIATSSLVGGVTIVGTSGQDLISATRTVQGQPRTTAFTDVIFGLDGPDRLEGGGGEDLLYGGAGNDIYTVDSLYDLASEADRVTGLDDGGFDIVNASADHTLGAFVENLTLTGMAALGTGNDGDNRITGNTFNNVLQGGGGRDIIGGDAGEDTLHGDAGNDNLSGGDGADLLFGGADTDILSGNAGIDRLEGGDGDDRLDGGTEADVMLGGLGADRYTVDNSADVVDETGGDGVDIVTSSANFLLSAGVETLVLTGSAILGVGNELANRITGHAGTNFLQGLGGNDTLVGGDGIDRLEGGAGNDRLDGGAGVDDFVFNQAPGAGVDTLADFVSGTDRIVLDPGVFGIYGLADAAGSLLADRFHLGADAAEANDQILYDATRGRVFFDADGTGAEAKVHLFSIAVGSALSFSDVFVL